MEYFIIAFTAFLTALLTFFSGFGLGTILLPVFAIFFPLDIAIAMTGVVHFANNIFKIALVGRSADKTVLLRFGLPAVLAAFAGAWVLLRLTDLPVLYSYSLFGRAFDVTPVKLIVAMLLILFSVAELSTALNNIQIGKNKLLIGGLLSGFFGGLSGMQGAIRSAFLIKSGLPKEAFVATGVAISCLVDFSRLSVYSSRFLSAGLHENISLLVIAILSAISGAFLGNQLLKKVTLRRIQTLVAVMLLLLSIALGMGLI